jgi:ABC-2 type transport system permease protein
VSVDRTLAVAVRVLRQLRRDHRSVAMILLVPPLLLALMWGVYYNAPQIFERAGPMLLGLFPFVTMFLVTSITTLRERSLGTLDRLMVSPIGRGDVMAGYAVAFLLIAAVQTCITVVVGVWLLDLNVRGSLAASVLLVLAQALLGITLGLFLSAFAQSEFQVVQFMPLAILPQIFFAGLLVPIEQMPDVLQLVSVVVPLRYSLEALSGVMLLGEPMFGQELWVESSVTLMLPIVVLALSWMTLRRTSDA